MAEQKIYIVILTLDVDCHCCNKKIRKILCKLQECENIVSIVYDDKKNTVTLSGPFDPQRLSRKLCCKVCKVIKGIEIKEKEKEKKKEDKKEEKKKEPPKPETVFVKVVCQPVPDCSWRPPCQGCEGGCGTCARPCGCSGGVHWCSDKCCSPPHSCCSPLHSCCSPRHSCCEGKK